MNSEKQISKKLNNFLNKNNLVEPLNWVYPNKKEFVNWINETFLKYRATGKNPTITNSFTPFKYQKLLRDYMQNNSPYRGVLLYHGLGSGKCHGINTPILMYDGSIKLVQNIEVGDQLMGDDSNPRNVLSLATGEDTMYKIIYEKNSYIVNSEHILVLKDENNEIFEMTVLNFLDLPPEKKETLYGYRTSINFPEIKTIMNPYNYGFNINNIIIDNSYIINSKDSRFLLLSGIIDANYKTYSNSYIIKIFNKENIYKIKFLCYSLGVIIEQSLITIQEDGDPYYLLRIYGTELNNLKLNNKQLLYNKNHIPENKKISYNNKYIFEIKKLEKDTYYGFTLDGNNRYLIGDFTVTHNTCSAITIAENLKTEKNVVVLLPASLRTNFIYDGLLFCGDSKYKEDPELYKEKYSFISYNANNTLTQLRKIGSLDNKVIIIEEVHNLISKIMSGIMGTSKQGTEIYNALMNSKNTKIIAMSGTPLINDPFETALLFNLLRGYIEITYYRILRVDPSYGEQWNLSVLEEELMNNPFIDYLEINKVNRSIEFHIKVPSYSEQYRDTLKFIEETCSRESVIVKYLELKKVSLFPIDDEGDTFRNYFVDEDIEKGDKLKNEEVFKRRILGLISYYKSTNDNYPEVKHTDYYRVNMSDYQFLIYEILRAKERLSERGTSNKKKKEKITSTFRVFSRQASNFVFPEEIHRPYPDPRFVVSLTKKQNNNSNTSENIKKMMKAEELLNENGKLTQDYKLRIQTAIDKLVENGEKYLVPGPEGLDKLSPKMKTILENVNKSPGLVFIYSNFRTLEGVEIFSKVLDFNGYSKYVLPSSNEAKTSANNKLPKYAIYSGTEDEDEKREILKIFTSPENKYGKFIKIILATSAGAEGLDLKNIRQIHIMEPYWNQMRIEQVIGRGVRRNSHMSLPPKDRNIEIFRYFTVYSKKDLLLTKDKLSTDEHIERLSLKKQLIINQLIEVMKECAFDCVLNAPDIKGEYSCYNFGKDAKGFSYHPNISKDIIESYTVQNKKKVERLLTRAIYYDKLAYLYDNKKDKFYLYYDDKKKPVIIDRTKARPIFIDKDTSEVFDAKSVAASNPQRIGFVNGENRVVKTLGK